MNTFITEQTRIVAVKNQVSSELLEGEVVIPNLEGDGIAEIVPLQVQAYTDPDTNEEVLTPESLELIE